MVHGSMWKTQNRPKFLIIPMKTSIILIITALVAAFFPACERQSYSETKMFHDVPVRAVDAPKVQSGKKETGKTQKPE